MTKKKKAAVAVAAAAMLALGGTLAWLSSADGAVTNEWDANRVRVELTETGVDENGVNDSFSIVPGTEQTKDPKISATADIPAYVYAIVKDNTHGLVEYEIDLYDEDANPEGWKPIADLSLLTGAVSAKDKDGNEISIDPSEDGVSVYYREVTGSNADHEHGPWSVLKGDKVSYSGAITNEDMYDEDGEPLYDDISLVFSAYAVQKEPFNSPENAWNGVASQVTAIDLGDPVELEAGAQKKLTAAVSPESAPDKSVTWSSSDESVATVDSEGNVTAVSTGTAVIAATAADGSGVSGTCTVRVVSFGYAVQLHSIDNGTVTFWPAMGVNAVNEGIDHGGEDDPHDGKCIHDRDVTWSYIKLHPEEFEDCVGNLCTKKLELNSRRFADDAILTIGDGGGMLYDGLSSDQRKWDSSGRNDASTPSYNQTLAKIDNSMTNGPEGAEFFLIGKSDLTAATSFNGDRLIYRNNGATNSWWLADRVTTGDDPLNGACRVSGSGVIENSHLSWVGGDETGIAPAFRY